MMVPVILGMSFILFAIMNLTPGDPARLILGEGATQADVDQLREEMGLNENFFVRYVQYIINALHGDFGKSYRTRIPVSSELLARFPTTLKLAFGGMFLAVIVGIPVGIISAIRQYSFIDNVSMITALLLTSIPVFWLGLLLILLFSLRLDILPATGIDTWRNYIMPSFVLAASTMAMLIRMTRSTMLEVIRQDYIRTAKAKGADPKRVVMKHALRNALLPVVTLIGMNFGIQLGGTVITESVFAIPGLGNLMITSVRMKDTPMLMASVLFSALVAGLVNLAVDVFYIFIDPRLKSTFVRTRRA